MFPSPYGDFVFQQGDETAADKAQHAVSVPLRGFCFSTQERKMRYVLYKTRVSVPLRGFCFSTAQDIKQAAKTSASFRPLTGILFFKVSLKGEHLSL